MKKPPITQEIIEQELMNFWPLTLRELPTFGALMREKYSGEPSTMIIKGYKKIFNSKN